MNQIASSLVNGVLSIEPLAKLAKYQARKMMINRAETLGVYWRDEVNALRSRHSDRSDRLDRSDGAVHTNEQPNEIHPDWEAELAAIANPNIVYPSYYTQKFHAYDEGNLGWLPAMEVGVAARAVHARIWPEADERSGLQGDASLRVSYHQVLKELLPTPPNHIVDLGCSTGRSSFALQKAFPAAQIIGVDLSPHFLTVAHYQAAAQHQTANRSASLSEETDSEQADLEQTNKNPNIRWVHAAAEATGLPAESADLVSACLVFHELPIAAAQQIVAEAYRLIRPGGHFAIMDMNPQSETFAKMQPYVLTLLKSTEPFLDQYLALDIAELLKEAGFSAPSVACNTPRHRAIVACKKE